MKIIFVKYTYYENSLMTNPESYEFFEDFYNQFEDYRMKDEHRVMWDHCHRFDHGLCRSWKDTSFLIKQHGWDYVVLEESFRLSKIDYCVWIVEET